MLNYLQIIAFQKNIMKNDYPKVAVDLVIFSIINNELSVALIQMKKKPFENKWAFPGGLVELNESVDSCAKHTLKEKTGISNIYLEQLYTAGETNRDPIHRVVSVVYFALLNSSSITLKTSSKYKATAWFPIKKLPSLAYDHSKIAKMAYVRLQSKLTYTNIVYGLLPKHFTLSELQQVYEIILDQQLDKRNFRKKILALKVLSSTKKFKKDGAHRPALLYSFKEHTPKIIEIM